MEIIDNLRPAIGEQIYSCHTFSPAKILLQINYF
jgi:hypothetical protein